GEVNGDRRDRPRRAELDAVDGGLVGHGVLLGVVGSYSRVRCAVAHRTGPPVRGSAGDRSGVFGSCGSDHGGSGGGTGAGGGAGGDVPAEGAEFGDGQAGEGLGAGGGVLLHDGGEDRGDGVGHRLLWRHAAAPWGQWPTRARAVSCWTAARPVARSWWWQAHNQSATGVWSRSRPRTVRPAGIPSVRAGCSLTRPHRRPGGRRRRSTGRAPSCRSAGGR